MAALTLYDSPGSPCARRVRITLIVFSRLESFPTLGMSPDHLPGVARWMRSLQARPAFAEV
jgi:glutathione S-transferase